MAKEDNVIRFEKVLFAHGTTKSLLNEIDFNVRRGSKVTIMGQNGSGKSTIFGLIVGDNKPDSGIIHKTRGLSVAMARQVIPRADLTLSIKDFFEKAFKDKEKIYNLDPRIEAVLEVVNLHAPHDKLVGTFSGGQQARLLLAFALIQDPDLLLLDEPTNNLDKAGILHLTKFLVEYKKTCIVISHDADFLNAFTHGVLYLDANTGKVEQYVGDYLDVVKEIAVRVEKENRKNALLSKEIQEKKDKANVFAHKGGQMRLVAKRMRQKAEELEEEKVDIRREDKTIHPFTIPAQTGLSGEILGINSFVMIRKHKPVERLAKISLHKNQRLLLAGPNGIGKSSLLESIAKGTAKGAIIASRIKVGYYRQDFSNLDFEKTVYDELAAVMDKPNEHDLRSVAAKFLIVGDLITNKIGTLSEGQKGLVAFARLVLLRPGLLILDEPTNHINFRHIPVIAEALNLYEGAMVLVSHVPDFVSQIRINEVLDFER